MRVMDTQNVTKEDEVLNNMMGPGGPQGPPQQQRINVDLSKAEDVVCECGCGYFMEAMRVKKLSMLLSPTGREEIVPIQTLVCLECGKEISL